LEILFLFLQFSSERAGKYAFVLIRLAECLPMQYDIGVALCDRCARSWGSFRCTNSSAFWVPPAHNERILGCKL